MSFATLLAVILSLSLYSFTKPLKGSFAALQVPSPTASLPAGSTACRDIIVAVKNGYDLFPASKVYHCLQSIPFNPAVAMRFLDYYNMTLQFQSTIGYLKEPPPGFQQPPFDVNLALENIKQDITEGAYKNQYDFEAQIQLLVSQMRDTHVILNAGALSAFSFVSPYGLVSASVNGRQTPEIYLDNDLSMDLIYDAYKSSPIIQINDVDVVEYLTRFAARNSLGFLEPHADWNAIMDSPALDIQGYLSTFQSATLYPGDDAFGDGLKFTFKNGTTIERNWWAFCIGCDETGPLTTGGDFYNYFVLGFLPESYQVGGHWWLPREEDSTHREDSERKRLQEAVNDSCSLGNPSEQNWCNDSFAAYPNNPFVAQTNLSVSGGGIVSGYVFDDLSLAVLSIPSFYQSGQDTSAFNQTVHDFINNASQASRVVIDLQRNSGGLTFLAYNTFKQFFPNLEPNGASRQRSHELGDILGKAYTKWWNDPETDQESNYQYAASEWIVTNRINIATQKKFSSWEEFYGPEESNGDTFSGAQKYNFSDPLLDYAAFNDMPWGYDLLSPPKNTTPRWAAEDIIILTDGICASACAIFVELMTHEAGVRTIAVGGQPTTGPMQAVSGTRSAAAYSADALDHDFKLEFPVHRSDIASKLPNRTDTGIWIKYAGITIRNQVRETDLTPLQFQYQAADCRIYYTFDTVYNMTKLWQYAARAAWNDTSLCVEDSLGYPTALNKTSSKAPPPINTEQIEAFDLDWLPEDPLLLNYTFELIDGPRSISKSAGQIVECKANGACDSGTCGTTYLDCSYPWKSGSSKVPVKACLPSCDLANGPSGGCSGVNVFCDVETFPNSKAQGSGGSNAKKGIGHCKTNVQSPSLPCPKS